MEIVGHLLSSLTVRRSEVERCIAAFPLGKQTM
jgi:hypothetical protein